MARNEAISTQASQERVRFRCTAHRIGFGKNGLPNNRKQQHAALNPANARRIVD